MCKTRALINYVDGARPTAWGVTPTVMNECSVQLLNNEVCPLNSRCVQGIRNNGLVEPSRDQALRRANADVYYMI